MSSIVSVNDIAGSLELRKLRSISPSYFIEIVRLLDENDYWKVLMGTVPKELPTEDNFHQSVDRTCEKRYNSAQVELVANASKKDDRTAAHIFLFEWSTTGRRRPTLDHLVILMKAANLYGPANYVATRILQKGAIEKPSTGPGKSWSKELDEMEAALAEKDENVTIENNLDNSKPMNTLCAANAPKLCVPAARSRQGSIGNKTSGDKSTFRIEGTANVPAVQVTAASASAQLEKSDASVRECKVDDVVLQSPPQSSSESSQSGPRPNFSGLMSASHSKEAKSCQFSGETVSSISTSSDSSSSLHPQSTQASQVSSNKEDNTPHLSSLSNMNSAPKEDIPEPLDSDKDNEIRPQLSALLDITAMNISSNKTDSRVSLAESVENSGENRPNFSGLLGKSILSKLSADTSQLCQQLHSGSNHSSKAPNFSHLMGNNSNSHNLPAFSALHPNVNYSKESSTDDTTSSDDD